MRLHWTYFSSRVSKNILRKMIICSLECVLFNKYKILNVLNKYIILVSIPTAISKLFEFLCRESFDFVILIKY